MVNINAVAKVQLKPLTIGYLDDFLVWATDDEVTRFLTWDSYSSKDAAEQFLNEIASKHRWMKAIVLDGKAVGSISLDRGLGKHACKAEVGYVVARSYWSYGIASAALLQVLELGFKDLDISRIEAYVDPKNIASIKVLEKCGFKKEGYLEKSMLHKGQARDSFLFSFLNSGF